MKKKLNELIKVAEKKDHSVAVILLTLRATISDGSVHEFKNHCMEFTERRMKELLNEMKAKNN